MTMTKKDIAIIGLSAILLMAGTAAATMYINNKPAVAPQTAAVQTQTRTVVHQRSVACNDGNVMGKVLGGVGGGVLGSAVGKGSGKTAATIGGTLGGAYVGGQMIPTQNATCAR